MQATIIKVWDQNQQTHIAVRVTEASGDVEYISSVSNEDLKDLTKAEKKQKLIEAVKTVRDAQVGSIQDVDISGVATL